MNDLRTSPHRSASGLASLIGMLGVAGVAVLLASVALAVGGPLLDLPGVQIDPRVWAAGSVVLGGVALLVLPTWLTRKQAKDAAARQAVLSDPPVPQLAMAQAQAQLHALVQAVPQGVALTRERRFEWANGLFCEQMGWSCGELLGRSPYEVFSSVNADDGLGAALRAAFAAGLPYAGELHFRRRDGSAFPGRLQARQVDPGDPAAGTLWQLDDLSHRPAPTAEAAEAAEPAEPAEPARAASHDPLTRLLNRRAFELALAAWLRQAPSGQTASLLHLDLDGFKAYNAAAGRAAGDALLRAVADTLRAHVRAGDAVARLEGDAYALLLPGCVAAVAVQLGQRLRAELLGLGVSHRGQQLSVCATVGVAEIDRRSACPHAADAGAAEGLARSRAAWHAAKSGGGSAVRLAAPSASVALVLPA